MSEVHGQRLFMAPHLDDCAVSFGGTLLAEKHQPVKTTAVTVFSRSNYTKDGLGDADAVTPIRQGEERKAMGSVGADTRFLDCLEAPLRGYTISDPLDYPRLVNLEFDVGLIAELVNLIEPLLEDAEEILLPLAVGDDAHVDHRVVRQASEQALHGRTGIRVGLYEDVPYIRAEMRDRLTSLDGLQLEETLIDLEAKMALLKCYESQPFNDWEPMIRDVAGDPPVERRWILNEVSLLPELDSI